MNDTYVYIHQATRTRATVTFNPDGTKATETTTVLTGLPSAGLRFGDLAQPCDGGSIYGSSIGGGNPLTAARFFQFNPPANGTVLSSSGTSPDPAVGTPACLRHRRHPDRLRYEP